MLAFAWVLGACSGWNFAVCVGPKNVNASVCVSHDVALDKARDFFLRRDAGAEVQR